MTHRVVAHVGQMKSGTTFIQQTLAYNRDRLQERDVLFPGPKYNQQHACYGLCGNDVYWVHDQERWRHAGDALLDSIAEFDGTVIISAEALSCMPEAGIERFVTRIGGIDTVVVTVRNMLSTLLSAWQQGVKRGAETSLSEFFLRMTNEREAQVGLWRNYAFGNTVRWWSQHADVALVVVDSYRRDEVADVFLRAAGVDRIDLSFPQLSAKDRNVSLRWEDAEFLRALNRVTNARGRPHAEEFRGFLLEQLLFPATQAGIGSSIKFPDSHVSASISWAQAEIAKCPESTTIFGDIDRLLSTDAVETAADAAATTDITDRIEQLLFHWFTRTDGAG